MHSKIDLKYLEEIYMINEQPSVYIILVNYNGINDTIECIESLKKINYSNYKIIIIDNGSSDNSVNILREKYNSEIKIIDLKKNYGFAGGNNIGINMALNENIDYVLLLNNDTVVEKNFLKELVILAENNKQIGVVGGKIYYFDDKKKIWYAGAKINTLTGKTKHIGVDEYDKGQYDKISETDYVTGCMMLVSTNVIKRVGNMDESYFLYYEETDWSVRIKNAGYKLIYQPNSIIYHKVSRSTKKINHVMGYYYDRNSYYFVMKNYGILNKSFMYVYKRGFLVIKYFKGFIQGNDKKCKMVLEAYKSIKNKETGKYNG